MNQLTHKTCTKCKIEKPLSDFHRRGHRHQNICKSCRLEAAKQPKSPRSKKQRTSQELEIIGNRIKNFEPRLRLIARQYASDPHQAQDIFQYVCEKLLLQSKVDESDSKFLVRARTKAGDFLHMSRTYTFYVGDDSEIANIQGEDNDVDIFEMYVGEQQTPEDLAIQHEEISAIQKALETLTPENRKVVALLKDGYSPADIAREFKVSRAAICMRIGTIARQLVAQGLEI
jgi:RNA polymerase sigma factor (sigma-70 family)